MNLLDVIGPIMIGPSSSHTAGAVRLGRLALALLGEPVQEAQRLGAIAAAEVDQVARLRRHQRARHAGPALEDELARVGRPPGGQVPGRWLHVHAPPPRSQSSPAVRPATSCASSPAPTGAVAR